MAENLNTLKALSAAKKTLARANSFESSIPGSSRFRPKPKVSPVSPKPVAPSPQSEGESVAAGLKAKQGNVKQYLAAQGPIPKMHKGGKVKKTGLILAKEGERVLTPEQNKSYEKKVKVNSSSVLSNEESSKISSLPITAAPIAYFVRHGDTDMNDDNVFRGDHDPSLNESGKAQAALLVHFFKSVNPSAIYHSSRKRTQQTVDPIAKAKGIKPKLTKDLDSLDTGNFAGQPKDGDNKKKMKWYREHPDAKIPGGQTVRNFQNDVDGALDRLLKEGDNEAGKPVVAGVHGSIIKELGRYLHGDIQAAHVEPGGVVGVYKLPSGAYVAKPLLDENHGDEELDLDS